MRKVHCTKFNLQWDPGETVKTKLYTSKEDLLLSSVTHHEPSFEHRIKKVYNVIEIFKYKQAASFCLTYLPRRMDIERAVSVSSTSQLRYYLSPLWYCILTGFEVKK